MEVFGAGKGRREYIRFLGFNAEASKRALSSFIGAPQHSPILAIGT